MHLEHLISLSHCVSLLLHPWCQEAGDLAVGHLFHRVTCSWCCSTGGGGEITQPHLLPTHPRSVHRKQYNQINSMGAEDNATTVLPALWLLCVFQS